MEIIFILWLCIGIFNGIKFYKRESCSWFDYWIMYAAFMFTLASMVSRNITI